MKIEKTETVRIRSGTIRGDEAATLILEGMRARLGFPAYTKLKLLGPIEELKFDFEIIEDLSEPLARMCLG